jgi:hypothetical protein
VDEVTNMAVLLTDADIERLVAEVKPLEADYTRRLKLRTRHGHRESDLQVTGTAGSFFRVKVRQAIANPLDFSVILTYCLPNSNRLFRLRRYNGRSHEHRNKLEGNRFYDFHVHLATERYQADGSEEDKYAEVTDRYSTVDSATACLLQDCGFVMPGGTQRQLL